MIAEILSNIFLVLGALVMVLAGIGLVKFPDGWMQLAASSKASTLSLFFFMLAASFSPLTTGYTVWLWLAYIFFLLSTPLSSHLIGRAALIRKEPMSPQAKDTREKN